MRITPNRNKFVTAIVAAAGLGKRMGHGSPKPFIKLVNKPLLFYSLDVLEKSALIDDIVLVVSKIYLKKAKALIGRRYKKIKSIVSGGSTRARSVYNGLCAADDRAIVLIHDAARPFITGELIRKCVNNARKGINCIAAVPTKPTIKRIDIKNKYILSTLKRKILWEAQTPQVFRKETLARAYKKLGKRAFNLTDDASLLEATGSRVKVIPSDYSNIKITTKEDLKIAEALLKNK